MEEAERVADAVRKGQAKGHTTEEVKRYLHSLEKKG
jgi:hypothetical protein